MSRPGKARPRKAVEPIGMTQLARRGFVPALAKAGERQSATDVALRRSLDLTDYDPEQGLQALTAADALITHFTRAKDVDKLNQAVEMKVIEQAKYVVARDRVVPWGGKQDGSRAILPAADPGIDMAKRWRALYCATRGEIDRAKVAAAIEDAQNRCRRLCEGESATTAVRGTEGTGEVERYTPAEYIKAAREVLGEIDLDPATSELAQATVKATNYFTVEMNGLQREWHGRVWLNPPYHRKLGPKFIDKLLEEIEARRTTAAIMLTNNSTDADWFAKAQAAAADICFGRDRVEFTDERGNVLSPTQGQAFFYFGSNVERFREVFEDNIGWLMHRNRRNVLHDGAPTASRTARRRA